MTTTHLDQGLRGDRVQSLVRWAGLALFAAMGAFFIAFGLLYASVDAMLWFHAAAVPEPIRGGILPLYLALMKLIGGASAALGALGLYVTLYPLRLGVAWAAPALAAAYAIPVLVAAYVAETLAKLTGAPTSWHIMGILLFVITVACCAYALSMRSARPQAA